LLEQGEPMSLTPDGKRLGFVETPVAAGAAPNPCMVVRLEGDPNQPRTGTPEACSDSSGMLMSGSELSPDGHWIAYTSIESGEMQVLVRPFPERGGKWLISAQGGTAPRWSGDGRQLFYLDRDSRPMTVPVRANGDSLVPGQPRMWMESKFEVGSGLAANYSPSQDGERVLMPLDRTAGKKSGAHVGVVLNFFDEVGRRSRAVERR
jgi:serine/threonine-protein kinase